VGERARVSHVSFAERLADESSDALLAVSLTGQVLWWNRGAEKLFGYSAHEAVGASLDELIVPAGQRDEARRQLDRSGATASTSSEALRQRRDRSFLHVDVTMRRVDVDGEQPFIAVTGKDVSQLRLLREQQAAGNPDERPRPEGRKLEANRRGSEFLGNLSHELRTPLNAIIGFAELMHDGRVGPVSSEHQEYLGDILTSGRHLLQLLNDVLDLAKVDSGEMEFRPEVVDVGKVIFEVRDILRGLTASKRLHIETRVGPDIGLVSVDPERLKQVLYNYLSNAIEFTAEGGKVIVAASSEGPDQFRISVEDTGVGISSDNMDKLFVTFQQPDASAAKRHQGTGLGLALTKRIIEAQGGRVEVKSALGRGSTFAAVLPRVVAVTTDPPASEHLPFRRTDSASAERAS
jgi:PAS domain S-box-containing protein